ncbi:MAG: hypothetical protein ACJAZO_000655 [Myxococcota bacterium]|jgi:hypothetical protein
MSRWFLPFVFCACAAPVSDADLDAARERADAWFAAVGRQDCIALIRLSETAMDVDACQAQAAILHDRFITIDGIGTVIPHPEVSGAILAQGRYIEAASPEVVELTLVRSRAGWVVRL